MAFMPSPLLGISAVQALAEFGNEHCMWHTVRPAVEACLADDGTHPLAGVMGYPRERNAFYYFMLTADDVMVRALLGSKMDEHQRRILSDAIRGQMMRLRTRIGDESPPRCDPHYRDWQSQNTGIALSHRLLAYLEPPPVMPPLLDNAVPPPYHACMWRRLCDHLATFFRALVCVV